MEEQENFSPSNNFMLMLATSSFMGNKYFFGMITLLFLWGIGFTLYIIFLQYHEQSVFSGGTGLVEMILATVGIIWSMSFVLYTKNKQISPEEFVQVFYNKYSSQDKDIEIVRKGRFSSYKNLLKYKDIIYIGVHLEEGNFYLYTDDKNIHQKLQDNKAEKIDSKNVWLREYPEPSYEGRMKMLDEYIKFIKNTLK